MRMFPITLSSAFEASATEATLMAPSSSHLSKGLFRRKYSVFVSLQAASISDETRVAKGCVASTTNEYSPSERSDTISSLFFLPTIRLSSPEFNSISFPYSVATLTTWGIPFFERASASSLPSVVPPNIRIFSFMNCSFYRKRDLTSLS